MILQGRATTTILLHVYSLGIPIWLVNAPPPEIAGLMIRAYELLVSLNKAGY